MDAVRFRRTRVIANSKWLWLLNCWRSRKAVLSLLEEAAKEPIVPTAAPYFDPGQSAELDALRGQLQEAKQEIAECSKNYREQIECLKHERNQCAERLNEARKIAEDQQAAYRVKLVDLDRMHTDEVIALRKRLADAVATPSKDESKWVKDKLKAVESDLQIAKDGNRALLRFINVGHRLKVKLDPGTIRAALKKG
jgi:DNA mismatch repair ATPase MutS